MLIKRPPRSGIENSSALSDLAFLLIVYFIVIAGFNINRGFLINLPQKESVKLVERGGLLRFSIDSRGAVFFQESPLSLKSAALKIRGAMSARPNTAVSLSIDENAPWQSVVSFIELAQENNVESFSFNISNAFNGSDE